MNDSRSHPGDDLGDEQLRSALADSDPARHLPPLPQQRLNEQIDCIISGGHETDRQECAVVPLSSRRTRVARGSAAGLGIAAAAAVVVALNLDSGEKPAVTALTIPTAVAGGPATSCAEVTPEALQQRQLAFEAQVTEIVDGQVTLTVTTRFKGDVEDTVTMPQQPSDLPSEFIAGEFVDGKSYLITADTGVVVAACGQSGPATDELRTLYRDAFGN